jgi:peptidoglycan hydrolase-like protein with peptidoglycan-binding domain
VGGVTTVPVNDAISANVSRLPRGVQAAGYSTGSGDVPWSAADKAAHPGWVQIDQSPAVTALDEEADVLDVEYGAATCADVPGWAKAAAANFASGKRPGQRAPALYVNLSNVTSAVNELVSAKITGGVSLWLANWNLTQAEAAAVVTLASGPWPVIGVQYSNQGGGGSYDMSVFSKSWLQAVSGSPVPPVIPVPAAAPPFPWPAGNYIGLQSRDPACHSGYTPADKPHVTAWQAQMARRGWGIAADGTFGPASAAVAVLFQRQESLTADGLVGPVTWMASFVSPVT